MPQHTTICKDHTDDHPAKACGPYSNPPHSRTHVVDPHLPCSEDDVSRAKNQLKATILYSQDGTTGVAEDIGRNLLVYGRRIPKAELFARIDAVDAATVKAVANRFILDQVCGR